MSPLRKGKPERDAEEKAEREKRRKELSARLRGELSDEAGEAPSAGESTEEREQAAPREQRPERSKSPKPDRKTSRVESRRARKTAAKRVDADRDKDRAAREKRRKELAASKRAELGGKGPDEKPKAAAKPKATAEPKAKPSPKPKAKPAAEPKAKPSPKPKAKPAAESKPKPAAEPKAKPKAAASPKSTARPKPKAKPKSTAKPKPKAKAKPGSKRTDRGRERAAAGRDRRRKGRVAAGRKKAAAGTAAATGAASQGLKATGRQASKGLSLAGRGGTKAGALLLPVFAFLLRLLGRAERFAKTAARKTKRGTVWLVTRLDRLVTPTRMTVVAIGACAVCLAVSQYVDYRGVDVGQPEYVDVAYIAPPPQVDVQQAADNHSLHLFGLQISWMLVIGLAAVAFAVLALRKRRGAYALLVCLAGLAALAITLFVDRPAGLDTGDAGLSFAGAKAVLDHGFYVELVSSLTLILCGALLAFNLRPAKAPRRSASRRKSPPRRTATDERSRSRSGSRRPKLAGEGQ